jgi:hypothetical protein
MRNATTPQFEGAVRRDFFDPKPPSRPAKQPTDWRTVILTGIIAAAVVSTEAIVAWKPPSRPVPVPEVKAKPEVTSEIRSTSESPAPVVQPTPEPLVVRAQPIEPTVRRALPVEGQLYLTTMPDGKTLLVRYMGSVPGFDQLPRNPNLYDLYKVAGSGHAWVFMQPAGFSHACWVDP